MNLGAGDVRAAAPFKTAAPAVRPAEVALLASVFVVETSGSDNRASQTIAGATRTATASGSRNAICFGTSSPTISDA